MNDKLFTKLLNQVQHLTSEQRNTLVKAIKEHEDSIFDLIDQDFMLNPKCPKCESLHMYKWGKVDGLQRYRCKKCKCTFNALSGTAMSRLRKKESWLEYKEALSEKLSLTKSAEKCGINRTTALRWKYRFSILPTNN